MANIILHGGNIVWDAQPGRGGHIIYVLQWLEGLRRLGHEVLYCDNYDSSVVPNPTIAAKYFAGIISKSSNPKLCSLVDPSGNAIYGLNSKKVEEFGKNAQALISLGCTFSAEPKPWLANIHPRILIEQDPGFSHIWASKGNPYDTFGVHDIYFSVGPKLGRPECTVPTFGIEWWPVWNPVILDWWHPAKLISRNRFTTVAGWWTQQYQEFDGKIYGPKAEEMKKFIDLPMKINETMEIAMETSELDPEIDMFKANGWQIESPKIVCADAEAYRTYVNGSAGEFSCVKGIYAGTKTGWFSDRSACYLSSGRPVIIQDTGIKDLLPTGKGLFAVSTNEEAAEAIKAVRSDYRLHSNVAREIAEQYFDSDKVLRYLLEKAGL